VIQKHHPDAFQDTNLQPELESRGIERLVIAGIQTEYCVDTTCRRAYSLGYDVTLVKDAHSTWDTDCLTAPQIIAHHNNVLGGWFVELKEASEIEFGDVSSWANAQKFLALSSRAKTATKGRLRPAQGRAGHEIGARTPCASS
jgi:hypothetical protein